MQTVVYNEVQYYSKTGTASIFAYNLTAQATQWRIQDVLAVVNNASAANLTSQIFITIVSDGTSEDYLLAYYTMGPNTTRSTTSVVALFRLNSTLLDSTKTDTSSMNTKALAVTFHPANSMIFLTSSTALSALHLPLYNASFESFEEFKLSWRLDLNGTMPDEIQPPVVLNGSAFIAFLYPGSKLTILKAASGEVSHHAATDADKLVFAMGSTVAMTSKTGGVLYDQQTMKLVNIPYRPLAVASTTSHFVAALLEDGNVTIARLHLEDDQNDTVVWKTKLESGDLNLPAAASVDAIGVVYFVGASGEYPLQAFNLEDGTFLWKLRMQNTIATVLSPIIASSGVNNTYLLVDSAAGQYSFSPMCQGTCEDSLLCNCTGKGTYGASCSTACSRNNTCNGHGDCQYDGSCKCDANYFLSDCSVRCTKDLDCFNGDCNAQGVCVCYPNSTWYSMKCNQYCNATLNCSGVGTCDVDGNCTCPAAGWFEHPIRVMPHCAWSANYALIGIIIAIIGLGGMCIGLCLCCFCEKSRGDLPKNPAKLSLLKHKH